MAEALMLAKYVGMNVLPMGLAAIAEEYTSNHLSSCCAPFKCLLEPIMSIGNFKIRRAIGFVGLVNILDSSILMLFFGLKVGMARKESGVEYPAMYASGEDEKSVKFNCMQRGHQNALETHSSFMVLSVLAGLRFPLVTSLAGIVWCVSRYTFFCGYAEDGAKKRYGKRFAWMHWSALTSVWVLAGFSAASLICGC